MSDEKKDPDADARQRVEKLTDEQLRDILSVLREDPDREHARMDRLWQNIKKKLDELKI